MKQILTFFSISLLFFVTANAQVSLTSPGTPVIIDFAGFDASGFTPTPSSGQLDSDDWSILGFSSGDLMFGGSATSGDLAKGTTTGGISSGGLYSNDNGSNQLMWIQPTGSDFTPGEVILRIQNNSGSVMNDLEVEYTLMVFNDQPRANSFNFSWSLDNMSYTNVPFLDYTSVATSSGMVDTVNQSTVISGLTIANGGFIYIRWSGDDVSGGGSRDEFGLDDISLNIPLVSPNPTINFASSATTVSEGVGNVGVDVTISAPDDCNVDVSINTMSSTADAMDYTFSSPQTVTFTTAGATTNTVNVTITDDMMPEADEVIVMYLDNAGGTGGCTVGPLDTFKITIQDNEYPPLDIADVVTVDMNGEPDSLGKTCQLQGIVYGVNFRPGGLSFTLIDATDGINVFNLTGDYGYTVTEGDEVIVQGTIDQFSGLTEIVPDTVWMVSQNNTLKAATNVTQLNESTESDLIRLQGVHLVDPSEWTNSGSGFNVRVTDGGTDTLTVRIDADVNIYGSTAPGASTVMNITGLGGQFDSSIPYTEGYQLLPRYAADIDSSMAGGIPAYPIAQVSSEDVNGVADSLGVNCQLQGIVYGVNLRPGGLQFAMIDATAGITVFSFSNDFGYTVTEGDEIIVQGVIDQFNGLTEIIPDTVWMVSSGNALKTPTIVASLDESTESDLVRVENMTLVDPSEWTNAGSGFNVRITDGGLDTLVMRIDNDVNLYSFPAPTGTFNVTGIGGQFDSSSPFTEGYQIFPRRDTDIDSLGATDPFVSFSTGTANVDEDGGSISFNVTIAAANANPTTVDVMLMGSSTATNGVDFTWSDTTITFPASSSSSQSLTIPILDDMMIEPNETIDLILTNATNNATISTGALTITINDDDSPIPAYQIATVTTNDIDGVADSLDVECQLQGVVHGVNLRPGGLQFTLIDNTGGIAVFNFNQTFGYMVNEGDEIIVQGEIDQFNGLTEIIPDTVWLVSSGNPTVTPTVVTALGEDTESELITLENYRLLDIAQWTGTGSGFNVQITNLMDTLVMRIDNDVDLYNEPAPMGWFTVTGLGGQFDSSSPFTDGYQIFPRYIPDIVNQPIPQMSLPTSGTSVMEDVGSVMVDVTVSNPTPDTLTVTISVDPSSTASFGSDFFFSPSTLNIPGNNASASFSVSITDDMNMENDETIVLALSNPINGTAATATYTITIQDNDAGSIDPSLNLAQVVAYPNPTENMITVEAAERIETIRLFSLEGKLLKAVSGNQLSQKLDLNGLAEGLYVIEVTTSKGIWKEKIVKQ